MQALVYKSTGSWYKVQTLDGRPFNARIKGILKLNGITSTNPIAVGDFVEVVNWKEISKSMNGMFNDMISVLGQKDKKLKKFFTAFC